MGDDVTAKVGAGCGGLWFGLVTMKLSVSATPFTSVAVNVICWISLWSFAAQVVGGASQWRLELFHHWILLIPSVTPDTAELGSGAAVATTPGEVATVNVEVAELLAVSDITTGYEVPIIKPVGMEKTTVDEPLFPVVPPDEGVDDWAPTMTLNVAFALNPDTGTVTDVPVGPLPGLSAPRWDVTLKFVAEGAEFEPSQRTTG